MRFTPLTEQQAREQERGPLFPAGEYDFTCLNGKWEQTKKGDPMFTVTIRCYANNGDQTIVTDRLLPNHEKMAYRLRHFAECIGLLDSYNQGYMDNNLIQGRSGRCILKVRDSEEYGPKNEVRDYVRTSRADKLQTTHGAPYEPPPYRASTAGMPPTGNAAFDSLPDLTDDIPF